MSKQCLDVQQMQHLQELGMELKETILVWARFMLGKTQISDWEIAYNHSAITDNSQTIPAYTLQDVLDALPRFVIDEEGNKYYLQIEMMNTEFDDWRVSYKSVGQDESPLGYFQAFQLIDAAVRMLVLCYEEGYVKTNKNE